jgi:hypothetical protein
MATNDSLLTWPAMLAELKQHRQALLKGNLVALVAVVCAVPVPVPAGAG